MGEKRVSQGDKERERELFCVRERESVRDRANLISKKEWRSCHEDKINCNEYHGRSVWSKKLR